MKQADLALDAHQDSLLENPNVAYISTVAKNEGEAGGEYVIEVGLIEQEVTIDADGSREDPERYTQENFQQIPSHLVVPSRANTTAADARQLEQSVEVRVVVCGDIVSLAASTA